MTPFPDEGVQVSGSRRDESFSFAGAHLGDGAVMEHHPAQKLNIEMSQADRTARGLAAQGEGLGQNFV